MRNIIRRWIAMLLAQLGMFDLALRARGWPPMAGASDDDEDDDADTDREQDDDADEDAEGNEEDGDDEAGDRDVDEDELPDKVKAILKKERKARRDAERKLRARHEAKPKPKQSGEMPKGKGSDKDAPDEDDQLNAVTVKLRRSNLRAALAEHGVANVKAALKLIDIDDVDFDDADDEPTNLDDVLEDAYEAYPFLKPTGKPKPKAPNANGRSGTGNQKPPKLTAAELDAARKAGKTPEEWEALKGVQTVDDWNALQAARRRDAAKTK